MITTNGAQAFSPALGWGSDACRDDKPEHRFSGVRSHFRHANMRPRRNPRVRHRHDQGEPRHRAPALARHAHWEARRSSCDS